MHMPLTTRLNKILIYARDEAERLQNTEVEPEHLLLAILRLEDSTAYDLLMQAGLDATSAKEQLDQALRNESQPMVTVIKRSNQTERILRLSEGLAREYRAEAVGSVHLLLAILREQINRCAGYLEQIWQIDFQRISDLYKQPRIQPEQKQPEEGGRGREASYVGGPQQSGREGKTKALDKYGRDLSKLAREGKLDPVVGRDVEIERVVQILSRRKKNNPILIGDPGVGKSAIVEGLALRIESGENGALKGKRIITLDIASMVAGTTYRGQFEERMKQVLQELQSHSEIILFIDEIHTIIGAGNAQGALDAANILKPALARGEVQCIGATTTAEYAKSIEKDGALERRFQKVTVRPTTTTETLHILLQLREHYGTYHHVVYPDSVLKLCVEMSERYLTDRAFPDKAIDVMDEVGARAHARQEALDEQDAPLYEITDNDVASVVSMMSGVPVQRVESSEQERLRTMGDRLLQRVIGQDDAVHVVVRAIQRSRLGLRDPRRPIGTFFFLGPTGVGKTHLAQCLAEDIFGQKEALIRFDMSEYAEKHTASLLVGAPPGYVAHEDGGKLTEAVRRKPYSVVLFDEIEKAHPDIFNVLLQVLDEGRLTDRQGHEVDFRNTIIILTSNVGTRQLKEFGGGIGFSQNEMDEKTTRQTLMKALQKTFPPEFVNRLDNVVIFSPLTRAALARIIDIEVAKLKERIHKTGHQLVLSEDAQLQLLDRAYDPQNGARPVKRAIQTYLEDEVVDLLLQRPQQKRITIKQLNKKTL
ncbi:MAG: ATP-dependent Clp protease ATP-binding subunit [Paludibacteraceae bacterium]|nr:ATP-dependent Clp protease ATP-binding subunit [Paludibacteraceae bacterium]